MSIRVSLLDFIILYTLLFFCNVVGMNAMGMFRNIHVVDMICVSIRCVVCMAWGECFNQTYVVGCLAAVGVCALVVSCIIYWYASW